MNLVYFIYSQSDLLYGYSLRNAILKRKFEQGQYREAIFAFTDGDGGYKREGITARF
jgi:hypothetical protein